MTIQLIGQFLPLLLLAVFAACIILIVKEVLSPSTPKSRRKADRSVKQKRTPRQQKQKAVDIRPKQSELLGLVNGDSTTAQRLLDHAVQNNPGMEPVWYFEKVIEDLIRDRR